MNKYQKYLKFMWESTDKWYSDAEVANHIVTTRRIVAAMRMRALAKGHIKGMYVILPDCLREIKYKASNEITGYVSLDEQLPHYDVDFVKYHLASNNSLQVLESIQILNPIGYWSINQLAELVHTDTKKTKDRLNSLATSCRKYFYVHSILGTNKERLYRVVAPKEQQKSEVSNTSETGSTKAKDAFLKVFGSPLI